MQNSTEIGHSSGSSGLIIRLFILHVEVRKLFTLKAPFVEII